MATITQVGPVSQQERISSIDVVRGFALLGILVMNMTSFGLADGIDSNPHALGHVSHLNEDIWGIRFIFFDGKMRALFSMLFGAGAILLTGRAERRGEGSKSADIFTRRNMWLVLFGILHGYFIWWGDVLYFYGVTALLFLYPCRKLSAKRLFLSGFAVLAVVLTFRIVKLEDYAHMARRAGAAEQAQKTGQILTEVEKEDVKKWHELEKEVKPEAHDIQEQTAKALGGFWSVVKRNAEGTFVFESTSYYRFGFCDALGMMLIGMGLMQSGFLTGELANKIYAKIALWGYGIGVPLGLLMYWEYRRSGYTLLSYHIWGYLPYDVQRLGIAIGNAALVVLAVKAGLFTWLTKRLAAIGQTALSNYIGTSILCSLLFNGYGFKLFGKLPLSQLMLVMLAVWIVNLTVSPIWLKYFQFGPLEWVWRSLTYWKHQPMRRNQGTGKSVAAAAEA
jgi:uncharacterized protein